MPTRLLIRDKTLPMHRASEQWSFQLGAVTSDGRSILADWPMMTGMIEATMRTRLRSDDACSPTVPVPFSIAVQGITLYSK